MSFEVPAFRLPRNLLTQKCQESVNLSIRLTIIPTMTMIIIMTMIMPRRTKMNAYNRVYKNQDSLCRRQDALFTKLRVYAYFVMSAQLLEHPGNQMQAPVGKSI